MFLFVTSLCVLCATYQDVSCCTTRWLQPDSYLDPKQCEIECNRDDLKCSWPAVVTVYTKDQYGNLVNVPNLKVGVLYVFVADPHWHNWFAHLEVVRVQSGIIVF